MRIFFFLIVLANVLLFFWEIGVRQPQNENAQGIKSLALPGTVEPITLIGESRVSVRPKSLDITPVPLNTKPAGVSAYQGTPVARPGQSDSSLGNVSDCFEMGPFRSSAQASELQELMAPHAKGTAVTTKTAAQNDSWWVLIPKAESMDAAKARRQMLLDKGVKDFWLFNKGELQGAISLGLHETREKAEAAQRQFLEKGIVSEILPRSTRSESYWLRIPWNHSRLALDEVLQTLKMQNADWVIPPVEACRGY